MKPLDVAKLYLAMSGIAALALFAIDAYLFTIGESGIFSLIFR